MLIVYKKNENASQNNRMNLSNITVIKHVVRNKISYTGSYKYLSYINLYNKDLVSVCLCNTCICL